VTCFGLFCASFALRLLERGQPRSRRSCTRSEFVLSRRPSWYESISRRLIRCICDNCLQCRAGVAANVPALSLGDIPARSAPSSAAAPSRPTDRPAQAVAAQRRVPAQQRGPRGGSGSSRSNGNTHTSPDAARYRVAAEPADDQAPHKYLAACALLAPGRWRSLLQLIGGRRRTILAHQRRRQSNVITASRSTARRH